MAGSRNICLPEKDESGIPLNRLWTADYTRFLILNFLIGCTNFIQVATLPEYILGLGGSKASVGVSMGFFSFSALATRPVAGILLDRIGRMKVLIMGSFLLFLSLLLFLTANSLEQVYLLRAVNGVAFSLVSTAIITLIVDITHESRLKAGIGYYAVFGTLASAVGPALGMGILQFGTYTHLFLGNIIMGSIIVFMGMYIVLKGAVVIRESGDRGTEEAKPLRAGMFAPVILIVFLGFSLGLILTYVPVLGIERNLTNISLFFSFYALSIVSVRVFGSNFLDRLKPFRLYATAVVFQCSAFMILAYSHSIFPVLASAVLYGSAFAMVQPLLNFMQIKALPSHRKGLAGAVYFLALDTGFASGSMGFGLLLERTSFLHVFTACSVIVFSSIFLFTLITSKLED